MSVKAGQRNGRLRNGGLRNGALRGGALRGAGLLSLALLAGAFAACGSDATEPGDVGGAATGGNASGGQSSGGKLSGGQAGAAVGGQATAGAGAGGGTASGGDAGAVSGGAGGTGGAEPEPPPIPASLSESGLYSDFAKRTLAPGVRFYEPTYELWSDGAKKLRYIALPPGTKIDTTNQTYWKYPVGTRIWKQFARTPAGGGAPVVVETRFLLKRFEGNPEGDWYRIAFLWKEDESDALPSIDGQPNARGTDHDVPSQADCGVCHDSMPDRVLGFTALQLSHAAKVVGEFTLDQLGAEGALTKAAPPGGYHPPGTPTQQAGLGYLHANCGHCHNQRGIPIVGGQVGLQLWLDIDKLGSVQTTPFFQTGVNKVARHALKRLIFVPKDPASSFALQRMQVRNVDNPPDFTQMPQLATELVDPTGVKQVTDLVNSL